ncbi:MAG: glycosyltransferase family protein [Rhodothermales bacterium]|nr:glycosyltransferase family protein [Rhodothermales bacterium]
MARIIYALSGQGRGHTSRVMAISDALRQRGHTVRFCCGGTAREVLEAAGERVVPVPALRQVLHGNELRFWATGLENARTVAARPAIVERLADAFQAFAPDLLITDFEAFSPRAAARIGLPVLSFNHQQVLTETAYDLSPRRWLQALLAFAIIRMIVPKDPAHVLLTSFFFPPLKHPERTTLVPPIIRPAVKALTPSTGEHVLVYYNTPEGTQHVLDALREVDARFIVYNFDPPPDAARYPNIVFKQPCLDGFLADLASSRAVICTAGFTLISEALYLGKPLLVVPNGGIFEQTLNAIFLKREGLGEAVMERALTADDVAAFLARRDAYAAQLDGRPACGNDAAVACIEAVLARHAAPPPAAEAPLPASNGAVGTGQEIV